jgi:hypothetical protein
VNVVRVRAESRGWSVFQRSDTQRWVVAFNSPFGWRQRLLPTDVTDRDTAAAHAEASLPGILDGLSRGASAQRAKDGVVYFVEAVGADRIKIGFTSAGLAGRIEDLQVGCPFPIKPLVSFAGTLRTERDLHAKFAAARVFAGSEWFHATAALRAFVDALGEVSA